MPRTNAPDSYIQEAFDSICRKATPPARWYVCLMEDRPFYGGPEEGGWWGNDCLLVAFQQFPTEGLANQAVDAVNTLARELTAASRKAHGEQCLREMDWLDARGLDADYLPEPDGDSNYLVCVTREIPGNSYGNRHYE